MEGTLVDKDLRPVPNVRIERTWEWAWNGKRGSDAFTTDAQGHFEFPKVTGSSVLARLLPLEVQIVLRIIAHGPNGPVNLFSINKQDYADRTELDGKPINIVCRIDLEPELQLSKYWGTVIELK